jgi:hypothetical protein
MRAFIGLGSTFAVALFLATGVHATTYVDIDQPGVDIAVGGSHTDTLNLRLNEGDDFSVSNPGLFGGTNLADVDGYDPITQALTSAQLSFRFQSLVDPDIAEIVTAPVASSLTVPGGAFPGIVVVLGEEVVGDVLLQVSDTGSLTYTARVTEGNGYRLDFARLEGTTAVPEPSSALLSLVALAAVRGATRRRCPTA